MENAQIADVFDEIADLIELRGGNEFRVRSYRSAARTARDLSARLADLVEQEEDLSKLPHIGQSTADKIREIVETGSCRRLEELREEIPSGVAKLMAVPQLGPRKAMEIHEELEVVDLEGLREACEDHRIRELDGMGPRTEENILKGIEVLQVASGRFLQGSRSTSWRRGVSISTRISSPRWTGWSRASTTTRA
ncbi:MAG TPA: helix-hairpin-helix domain-containing protein, partial [Myxococcota bacterium]|nr:helix-hairpin-helix domain-containing protein [Myxococcota bacterium]